MGHPTTEHGSTERIATEQSAPDHAGHGGHAGMSTAEMAADLRRRFVVAAVLSVPITYPATPVNGVLCTCIFTPHQDDVYTTECAYPEAFKQEMKSVIGQFKIHPEPGDQLPPGFSPFFLGHFAQIPKARYVELMAEILRDGRSTYRVMVEDVYSQGYYMLKSKYRYLRFSYACFLIGFVAAAIELTITVIVS